MIIPDIDGAGTRLLEGLRVLDLTGVSGQLSGRLLADLGADVVKPELPAGDTTRRLAPFARAGDAQTSLLFTFLNAGKRSIVLDPDEPDDVRAIQALIARAQLILTSTDTPFDTDLVAPAPELQRQTGKVVVAISPFGWGSARNDLQTDLTIYAMSGLLNISGSPDLPPCAPPESQTFYYGSVWAALAGLTAIYRPDGSLYGEFVDVSLCETLTTQEALIRAANTGGAIERGGSQHRLVCPSNLFRTRDGLVQFHVNHTAWARFLRLLDGAVPELEDERWNSMDSRLAHIDEINALIEGHTSTLATAQLVEDAQRLGVACMPVNLPTDVLADHDMRESGIFVSTEDPILGAYEQPAAPYVIDGRRVPGNPSPQLDADGEAIRAELAMSTVESAERVNPARPEPPLKGVRVVTFTSGVAGPRAGRILAWLGAEVIKIESRNGGIDPFRYFGTSPDPALRLETSGRYAESNLNVSSVTLDLKSPDGRALMLDLIAASDVVMDNFRPGVLDRLGLPDTTLAEINPRAVVMHMPGFGSFGRRKSFGTWGPSVNAFTGMTALWNHPEQDAVIGTQSVYPDYLAAIFGPVGILAGLIARNRDGIGRVIEYAQVEGAIYMLGVNYLYASVRGEDQRPQGNRRDNCLASGLLQCAGEDRWCAFELRNEADLAAVAALISKRGELPDVLRALDNWAQDRKLDDVMQQMRHVGVPAGAVRKGTELLTDPAFVEHDFVRAVDQPHIGSLLVPYLPVRFLNASTASPGPAPQLGSANHRIIVDVLGRTAAEVVALEESGAVN